MGGSRRRRTKANRQNRLPPIGSMLWLGHLVFMAAPAVTKVVHSHADGELQNPTYQCSRYSEHERESDKGPKHFEIGADVVVRNEYPPNLPHRLVPAFAPSKEPCGDEQGHADTQPDPFTGPKLAVEIHVMLVAQREGERWRRAADVRIREQARPAAIRSTEKLNLVTFFWALR